MPIHPAFPFLVSAALAFAPEASAHSVRSDAEGAGNAQLELLAVVGLLFTAVAYAGGVRRLWRNAHAGAGISGRQAACFCGGWLLLAAALLSPIDTLGGELFSMHMVQHELMMLGAAPLFVTGKPLAAFIWAFRPGMRRRIGQIIRLPAVRHVWAACTRPLVVWLLHLIVLWAWHFPSLFQASLANDWIHAAQHASFLVSALLFWFALIEPHRRMRHSAGHASHYGGAVVMALTTTIHTGMLGALLTFSPHAWYPAYAGKTEHWGLTLLEDQQLGGLIMWVPAGFILIAAGMAFAARALGRQQEQPGHGALREEGQA